MKKTILVIGLGTFGSQAAKALFEGGATVLAVDIDEGAVERVSASASRAVCLDVNDEEALNAIGAFDVDVALIALRHHFATSVLSTHMLHRHGIKDIIVHVESEREGMAVRAVGATAAIFPERDMAERVAQHILLPDLADQIPLGGDAAIIEILCPKSFIGKNLRDLDVRRNHDVNIIAVRSRTRTGGERVAVVPSPDAPLKETDVLFALGKISTLEDFVRAVGAAPSEIDLGGLEVGEDD